MVLQLKHSGLCFPDDVDRSSRYIPSAILANDIFYDIQQHSGRYKRKHRPDILKSLYEVRCKIARFFISQGERAFQDEAQKVASIVMH